MSILTLPPELLRIIIGKLDTKSVYNLYSAGVECLQGLVTECQFSMNTLATERSLRTNFFAEVSKHLNVLNLSGVPDLNAPSLIDALTKMYNLSDLDITYTKIKMPDFLQIVKVRPTLKSICINYLFGEDHMQTSVSEALSLEYQHAFEGFKNVHLVFEHEVDFHEELVGCSRIEPFRGRLVEQMLQKANLNSLKFVFPSVHVAQVTTILYDRRYDYVGCNDMEMVKLSQFQVHRFYYTCPVLDLPLFRLMDFNKYEILVFNTHDETKPIWCYDDTEVFATTSLSKFISDHFNINVSNNIYFPNCNGELAIMFWDKERTVFDDEFFSRLNDILKEYLIFRFDKSHDQVPVEYKWYDFKHSVDPDEEGHTPVEYKWFDDIKKLIDPNDKRFRTIELDCDAVFQEKEKNINLNVHIEFAPNLLLMEVKNLDFLRKLNHLDLDVIVDVHPNFFMNLFKFANCLTTLNLYLGHVSEPHHLKFIGESTSLKNFQFKAIGGELSELYEYLSECRTLENIVLGLSSDFICLADPSDLFRKCGNLYNITIKFEYLGHDDERKRCAEMFELYKQVRLDLQKYSLTIDFQGVYTISYSSYLSVFNLFQLRPLLCSLN